MTQISERLLKEESVSVCEKGSGEHRARCGFTRNKRCQTGPPSLADEGTAADTGLSGRQGSRCGFSGLFEKICMVLRRTYARQLQPHFVQSVLITRSLLRKHCLPKKQHKTRVLQVGPWRRVLVEKFLVEPGCPPTRPRL